MDRGRFGREVFSVTQKPPSDGPVIQMRTTKPIIGSVWSTVNRKPAARSVSIGMAAFVMTGNHWDRSGRKTPLATCFSASSWLS